LLVPFRWKCGGIEMFYVYVLKSLVVERYYIGHTTDLEKRLAEHNRGKTRSTKGYLPWRLVYSENFETKSEAFRREQEIKSFKSGIKFKELQKLESWQSGCHRKARSRFAGNAAVMKCFMYMF
jgi:putative endonuclease